VQRPGYLGTNGIEAVDYRITDARGPAGVADRRHSEELSGCPVDLRFAPLAAMPAPRCAPTIPTADRVRPVNRLAKVQPAVPGLGACRPRARVGAVAGGC
jgi:hypothetical protein